MTAVGVAHAAASPLQLTMIGRQQRPRRSTAAEVASCGCASPTLPSTLGAGLAGRALCPAALAVDAAPSLSFLRR